MLCEHPFALWLSGAETPHWRKHLVNAGVNHVSINYANLFPRLGKKQEWSVDAHFPENVEVMVNSGGGAKHKTEVDHEDRFDAYLGWIDDNIERISYYTEYDPIGESALWVAEHRPDILAIAPDKFMPLWHAATETHDRLYHLADRYRMVGVVGDEEGLIGRLNTINQSTGCRFHAASVGKISDLRRTPYAAVTSLSWISPTKYGDAQVWHGGRMIWYPSSQKETARRRHKIDVENAGFDANLWMSGDQDAVIGFTLWSWRQLEADTQEKVAARGTGTVTSMSNYLVAHSPLLAHPESREDPSQVVAHPPENARGTALAIRERIPFPGMAHSLVKGQPKDDGDSKDLILSRIAESGLRNCDSCSLSSRCPAYTPRSVCQYNLSIEIRTKPQLQAAMESILETQMQRIAFARANEEADGIPLDPAVGVEMDRLMHQIEMMKEVQADPDFFEIKIKGKGQQGGILSQIMGSVLGAQAAANAQAVNPSTAEHAMQSFLDVDPID